MPNRVMLSPMPLLPCPFKEMQLKILQYHVPARIGTPSNRSEEAYKLAS